MPDGGPGKGKAGGFGITFKPFFKGPFQQAVQDVMKECKIQQDIVPKEEVLYILEILKIKLKMRLDAVYYEHKALESLNRVNWRNQT